MRETTLLKKLLGIKHLVVDNFEVEGGGLVVDVHPRWQKPRCSGCGRHRACSGYDTLGPRRWRHLDWGGVRIHLRYAPRRVSCRHCGVVVERVPWAASAKTRFTWDFEEQVGFFAQRIDKSAVELALGIAWRTVGAIIERVVTRRRPTKPLRRLRRVGVDELSYRKGHRYLTLVSDHDTGCIVWAKEGKSAETLASFFSELGDSGRLAIETVTIDMSQAYISAVRQHLPHAQIVFDRFHVQQLVSDALDETRREEWRHLRVVDAEAADAVKGLRYTLLKSPWNLTRSQKTRLSTLAADNQRLYRAYLLKESFADILDRRQPNVAREKLQEWLAWASRSRLPAFIKVAKTIRLHLDDIVAYIRHRLTNGLGEGLNNKARLLTRRAYGFHSPSAVIAMIMLCCTGIELQPIVKRLAN
jgi:transposase